MEATLSSKNQIVIPKEAREALGLKGGSKLLVDVLDDAIVIRKRPKSFVDALSGVAKGVYPKDYLKKERASW